MSEWGTDLTTIEGFVRRVIERDVLGKVISARDQWEQAKTSHSERWMDSAGREYYRALDEFWGEVRTVAMDAAQEVEG